MCYPIIIDEARLSLILSVICEFFGLIVQDASLRIQLIKNRSLPPAFDLDRLIWTADETLLSESTGKSHSKRSETSEMAFSERNQNANSQIESENSQIEDNVNYAKIEAELTNSNLDEDEMEEAEDKFRNLSHSLFHFAQCKVPFPLNLRSFLREWRYISEKRKRNMESEEEKCSEFQKDSEEFNTEQNIEDKRGGSEELTYEWGEKLLIAVTLLRHSLNPLNPLSDGSNISSEKIEKIAESVKEIIGGVNRQKQMQRPNRRKCSKQTNMKMNMKTDRKFNVSREEEEGDDDKEEIHKAMKFEEKEMKLITEKNNTENRNENKLYGGMMRMLLEVAIPETDENERKPFLELLKELCTNCKVNCNELHSFVRQTAEKIDKHSLKFTSTFRSSHEMQHQSRDLRMKCYSLQDRSSTETTTQQQTLTEQIPSFLKQLAPVTYAGITNPSSQCFMNAFVVQLFMHPQFRRTVISWRRCGTIQKLDEKIKEPEDFKQFSGKSHHSRFYADIVQKQHNRIRQFSSTKLETASAVMDALQIVFAQLEMKAYPFLFNTSDEETPEPHTEKEKKTETAASSTSTQTPQTSMGICSSSVSLDPLVLAYRDKADQQVDIRKQHDLREFGLRLLELLEIEAEVECEEARNFIEELFLGVRVTEQICCNSHRICHSEPFFFVDVAIGESTSLQEALEKERRGQKLKRLFCPICQKNQAKRLCMDKAEGEVKREKENTTEREEEEGGGEKEEKTNSRNFIKEKGDESKQPNGVGEGIVRCYLADVPNTLFFYLQRFQSDGIKAVKMDAHFEFPIYGLTISDYTKEEEEEEDDDDEGIEEKQQIDFDSTMNNSEQSSSSSPSSSSCNLDHTNTETKNKPLLKEIQNIGSDKQKAKSSSRDESYSVFDLVGVICHKGTINKGHYYSFAKEREAPFRWFKFNDHRVTVVAEEALKEECFGSTAHAQKKLRGTNISDSAHDMEDRADDKSSNAGNDSGFERLANKGKKRDFGAILLMYQRRHPINEWEQRETELIQKQFNRSFPSHETYTFLSPLLESLLFPLRIVKSSEDALNLLKNLKPQQQHYPILFHLTNQSLPAPLQLAVIPKLVRDACGINSFATVKRSINEMEEEIQENMPNEQFIQEIISDDFAELYKWICAKEEELAYLQQVKSRHSDLSYEDSIQQTSSQTSLEGLSTNIDTLSSCCAPVSPHWMRYLICIGTFAFSEDRFKAECEHIQSSIMKTSSIVPLLCCFCELLFVEQSNMNSAFYHIFFNAEKAKRDAFLNMIHMLITKAVDECEKQNCELIGGKMCENEECLSKAYDSSEMRSTFVTIAFLNGIFEMISTAVKQNYRSSSVLLSLLSDFLPPNLHQFVSDIELKQSPTQTLSNVAISQNCTSELSLVISPSPTCSKHPIWIHSLLAVSHLPDIILEILLHYQKIINGNNGADEEIKCQKEVRTVMIDKSFFEKLASLLTECILQTDQEVIRDIFQQMKHLDMESFFEEYPFLERKFDFFPSKTFTPRLTSEILDLFLVNLSPELFIAASCSVIASCNVENGYLEKQLPDESFLCTAAQQMQTSICSESTHFSTECDQKTDKGKDRNSELLCSASLPSFLSDKSSATIETCLNWVLEKVGEDCSLLQKSTMINFFFIVISTALTVMSQLNLRKREEDKFDERDKEIRQTTSDHCDDFFQTITKCTSEDDAEDKRNTEPMITTNLTLLSSNYTENAFYINEIDESQTSQESSDGSSTYSLKTYMDLFFEKCLVQSEEKFERTGSIIIDQIKMFLENCTNFILSTQNFYKLLQSEKVISILLMLLKGNYAFEVKRCAIALLCRTLMAQSIEFKKDSEIELHGVDEKLDSSLKQEKNKKRYISKTYELWKSMTKAIPATTDPKEDERFDKHFGKKASSDTKIHKFTNLLIEKQMKELHILEMGVENASYFCDAANEVEETEEWNEGYVFDEAKQLTYKDAIGDVLRWVFSELSKWMGKLYRILYAACTSFHKFDNPQSTFQIIESLPSEMIICVSIASMFDPRSNLFKEMLKDFATVGLFLSWMPDYKSFYSTRNNSLGNEGRNKLRISEKCFIREEQDRSESKRWMANVTLELLKFKKSKEEEEEEEEKKIIDACWIVVSAMKRAAGEPTRLPDLCLSTKELVDTKKFEEISGFKEKDYERDRKDNTMKTTHLTKDKNYETRSTLKEEFRKRTEFMNEVEQHLELPTSIFERLTTEARVFGSNDGVDLWKRLLDEEINSKESKEKKKAFTTREEDRKMRPQLKIETESTKDMMSSLFGKRKALMVLNSEEKKNSALFGKMEKDKEKKEEKWMCSDEGCRMNCPSLPSKWVLRQFEGTVMKDDLKKQNFQKETEMDDSNRKEKINDISSHEFEDKKLQLIYDKSHDTIVSSTEKFKLAIARHIELARNQTLQPALEIPKIPEISSMNSKTNQLSSIQNFHKDGGFVGSMKTEIKIEGSTNECVNGSCIFKQYEPELMVEKSSSLKEKATLFDGLDCEKKLGSTFFLEGEKKAHEEERTMATKSSSNEAQFPVLNSKELQSFTFKPFVPPTLTMQTPQSTQKALTVNSEKVSSNSFMPVSFGSKGVKSGAFRGMSKEPRSTRGGIVAPKIQFRELTAEELKKS